MQLLRFVRIEYSLTMYQLIFFIQFSARTVIAKTLSKGELNYEKVGSRLHPSNGRKKVKE